MVLLKAIGIRVVVQEMGQMVWPMDMAADTDDFTAEETDLPI